MLLVVVCGKLDTAADGDNGAVLAGDLVAAEGSPVGLSAAPVLLRAAPAAADSADGHAAAKRPADCADAAPACKRAAALPGMPSGMSAILACVVSAAPTLKAHSGSPVAAGGGR